MTRVLILASGILVLAAASTNCGSDTNSTGQAGTSGGAGTMGSAGTTGSGGAGGGSANFVAVNPCNAPTDYVAGNTITFATATAVYEPKCLTTTVSSTVTFMGDFSFHPLEPSRIRGTLTGNPITPTGSGTSAAFTFNAAGDYAYFCNFHGPSDTGMYMAGVIRVTNLQ